MGGRASIRAGLATVVAVVLTTSSYYVVTIYRREAPRIRLASADVQSADPQALLKAADRFYFLNNGPAAASLYARAEKLFSERGDARNELYAKVGQLRS